jgi:hypothetical protein
MDAAVFKPTKNWSLKEVDDLYNGSAGAGALCAWILDQTTGFNKNTGYVRLLTTIFTGVGIGGSVAYVYLYYQGVYEKDFVYSDYKGYR